MLSLSGWRPRSPQVQTAPAFCRPVWSRPATVQPSIVAAVATMRLVVTTPVPPMPTMYTDSVSRDSAVGGAARPGPWRRNGVRRVRPSPWASTPLNDGQKRGQSPSTQVRSWLRDTGELVLRPSGVPHRDTDRQLLLRWQSPQPSHTASLITARVRGSGSVPRFPQPPRLGGTTLVEDQCGDPRFPRQRRLGLGEPLPRPHR